MVLFAVDGGKEEGYNHPARAALLADACLGRGLEVSFVCANQNAFDYVSKKGFSRVHLADAASLLAESISQGSSLLFWDAGRPLTKSEVAYLHQHDLFVIEFDASDGSSYTDEVVNGFEAVLHSAFGREYQLVGPDYFVVDKCFSNVKEWRRASSFLHNGPDLFICFSGENAEQLLQSTLAVLVDIPACRSVQIRAVAEFDRNRANAIERHFSAFKNLQIYREADAGLKAQIMRFSHLGIISLGAILVEAMAVELPVLLIHSAQSGEEQAAKAFTGVLAGAGRMVGHSSPVDWKGFRSDLTYLLDRPKAIERMQMATRGLVDGQGARRIARYVHTYMKNRGKGQGSWVRGGERRDVIPLSQ